MKLTPAARRGLCWLYAALMTAGVMLFVLLLTDVRYATNDDPGILRAFVGADTGAPVHFHIFIHGLVAWPLYWLSCAFPALPWFTYVQMILLALSCLVIAKSAMQCFVGEDRPLWAGALVALAFVLVLCMKYISHLNFTKTAAILGAAAVWQVMSVPHGRGGWRVVMGMAGSLALVALAYAMRGMTALPVLAFVALASAVQLARHYVGRRSAKPMLLSFAMIAAVMLGLAGWRQAEVAASGSEAYLAWQDANSYVLDYYDAKRLTDEHAELAGWSPETFRLAQNWCFLDKDISTESFEILTEHLKAQDTRSAGERLSDAWGVIRAMHGYYPLDVRGLCLTLMAGALVIAGAFVIRQKRLALAALCALAGAAALLLYLAWEGRLPLRVVLVAVLPACALLCALLPCALPRRWTPLLAVCLIAHAGWCLWDIVPQLLPDEELELEVGSAMSDLEEYALWEPDSLFIYDDTLVYADMRAFPDYSEGVPSNITSWGGWGMRSPDNVQQFANFGIDILDFDPEVFLRDDVFVASGRLDPPPKVLWNWLKAEIGPDVECEMWAENGMIYLFHFYRTEE